MNLIPRTTCTQYTVTCLHEDSNPTGPAHVVSHRGLVRFLLAG